MVHQVVPHKLYKPVWYLIPTSCLNVLCLSTSPHVAVIFSNNCRILEIDYHSVNHPSLFIMTLCQIQTWEVWHHHNIIIKLICNKIIKLCLIPFTTKTSRITNIFCIGLLVNTVSVNLPSPIASILSMHYHNYPSSSFIIFLWGHKNWCPFSLLYQCSIEI